MTLRGVSVSFGWSQAKLTSCSIFSSQPNSQKNKKTKTNQQIFHDVELFLEKEETMLRGCKLATLSNHIFDPKFTCIQMSILVFYILYTLREALLQNLVSPVFWVES